MILNKYKKFLALTLTLILLIGVLCSCSGKVDTAKASSQEPLQSNIVEYDPENEPPLNEYEKNLPAPDFLDKEQQNLYKRAKSIYGFFNCSTFGVDEYPLLNGQDKTQEEMPKVIIDGEEYYCSQGRYQNYDGGSYPIFTSNNGKLCYHQGDRGSNLNHQGTDDFELISKTDVEIKFYVIGHYTQQQENETVSQYQVRRDKGEWDCTEKFPITMVKTENGWRFSEFNITY